MSQSALISEYKPRATSPVRLSFHLPRLSSRSYQAYIEDLQFAIQAGDETFAPALKLLLEEALQLACTSCNLSAQAYQMRLMNIRLAYLSLLEMDTLNPVARRIQERYRTASKDDLWNALKKEMQIFEPHFARQTICSDGNVQKFVYCSLKRLIDFVLALLLIVLLLPLLIVIAVLIKLDSPGPVFFVQERVGARKYGRSGLITWEIRNFSFYKFRSMYKDADQTLHKTYIERWIRGQAEDSGDKKARYKLVRDPRITPIGAILRKSSLDELPQLFNVLKGEMSLVGPRPVPTYEVSQYQREHYERLAAVPGMTGLWQVKGRGHVSFEEQVRLDVEYINRQSLWFDLKLMVLTVPAVVFSRGAK